MNVRLTPTAERQLSALSESEYEHLEEALDLLENFPKLGKAYAQDSPFSEKEARYLVVRVARNRAFRITPRLLGDSLVVLYVFPATYPLTHPDHLKLHRGDKGRP